MELAELARMPNVAGKLSGLVTEAGRDWTSELLAPYIEHALECFCPERLMLGSDWPVVRRAGGVGPWFDAVAGFLAGLTFDERLAIEDGTATRVYGL
jgi:L-fuconolactonase